MASKTLAATPGQALRWQAHKEHTRRELLASAGRLFAERGFQGTSAADIAAGAGVTERTLFRYFPNKLAVVLAEAVALLPELAELIRERPAQEPPYQAVCEGIIDFGRRHRGMMAVVAAPEGVLDIPVEGQQRPLLEFEGTLADVLRERYALSPEDQLAPAVWARASIGALRTALLISARDRQATGAAPPAGVAIDRLRACFAALPRGARPRAAAGRSRRDRGRAVATGIAPATGVPRAQGRSSNSRSRSSSASEGTKLTVDRSAKSITPELG